MTPEVVVEVFRNALYIIILIVAASIVPGLIVGLLVAVFQAATSINEQTLSFLPRLLVTLATLMYLANWIFGTLIGFANELYLSIPELIG
ncbi:flagellar biosynthetic protein FliQ [Aliikangiella sp. IMCC44359]|uniref:flagellar biosynthetic protein FliQ n=1 Tax=Aliikangiella sp. IMCC44359 TaxID=3459125 RepID=UPI00403A936D